MYRKDTASKPSPFERFREEAKRRRQTGRPSKQSVSEDTERFRVPEGSAKKTRPSFYEVLDLYREGLLGTLPSINKKFGGAF